jgi:hypothetical protein
MANVSEHHPEEKWKTDHIENSGVDLSIARNPVSVGDHLKWFDESIRSEFCGRVNISRIYVIERREWDFEVLSLLG